MVKLQYNSFYINNLQLDERRSSALAVELLLHGP